MLKKARVFDKILCVTERRRTMLTGPFLDRNWMGQNPDYNSSDIVMLGMPFDGTVSYRSGSRFAPEQIRLASGGWERQKRFWYRRRTPCDFT